MADKNIRHDFIEGMQEVFTTLFNDGSEDVDGVFFYALSPYTSKSIYDESDQKVYKPPSFLVCRVNKNPTLGEEVEQIKEKVEFTIPLKSLQENNLDVSTEGLEELRKGYMKYHDTFYQIDNISPKTYVEDVFLFYTFSCTEDIHLKSLEVESSE